MKMVVPIRNQPSSQVNVPVPLPVPVPGYKGHSRIIRARAGRKGHLRIIRARARAGARARWVLLVLLLGCTPQGDPGIGSGFHDDFERAELGSDYKRTGGNWRIENGQLHVKGAKNHPLWLLRTLPRDVRVELDARSESAEGDIKVELFGDGASHARQERYEATSYVIIFGGWNNSKNVLARMDEHGADRVVGEHHKVESGRTYRFRIERVGGTLTVWVDGDVFLQMDDPEPLAGRGHDHFGFNNWQSDLWFDNLKITPL